MPTAPYAPYARRVRVRARNELPGQHEALLRKVEVEDAVARGRVVRPLDVMLRRELASDAGLLVVVRFPREDEVIVCDRRLPRIDRAPARDLIERVNGKWRGSVRRRQQVRIHAQRRTRLHVGVLVDAMRPHDLFGAGQSPRDVVRREDHLRIALDRRSELAPPDGEDPAAAADLVFLGRERHRRVAMAPRDVLNLPRRRIERELVAVPRIGNGLRTLDDVQAEVERIAPEDVAHVVAADDHQLAADFFGDGLQAGRRHLARRSDGESIAGDHERGAGVNARAKIRHQVAERTRLPTLIERVQAFGHAVSRRRDLIGVDRIELPVRVPRVPEDQRGATDELDAILTAVVGRPRAGERIDGDARLQNGGLRGLHLLRS